MTDFISREALENWVREEVASLDSKEDREFVIQRWRKEIPAADVAPVVRCRECKWGGTVIEGVEYVWCGKPFASPWAAHKADWYCADGKRKEDAKDATVD